MWIWFNKLIPIINIVCNMFTAIGTVGAVIVALWLANKKNKPKLNVYATVYVITPDMTKHVGISCVNRGRCAIICTGFAFNPNRFKKIGLRFLINPDMEIENLSTPLPKTLQYSDKAEKHIRDQFINKENLRQFLSQHEWLAKLQLKWCWRVIVTTNIMEFEGKLSNSLIEKIMTVCFPK